MNLIYGEILDVQAEQGLRVGRVRVHGAMRKIALELLPEAGPGDAILLCDSVALSKVEEGVSHVSGHPR